MIVLDTNVFSDLMRRSPSPEVVRWLDAVPASTVWTTSITVFEVRFGLALLAPGMKRESLESAFEALISSDLNGRVLDFDGDAAEATARIAAEGRRVGRAIDLRDAMIAGTVAASQGTLATRNVRHFEETGIKFVDPWDQPGRT